MNDDEILIPLSIVIPTVNRGELFRSPIENLLPQLRKGDQVVISINGPVEPVKRILEDYKKEFSEIDLKIISPSKKLDIYTHWDFAISHTVHKECVFIHDDEIYHSRLLEIARSEFSRDSEVALVTGGHLRVLAPEFKCYETISFNKREEFSKGKWIESQEEPSFPKYGCTAYVFRKSDQGYSFLAKNTRVSDALLMYQQSFEGKVIQRPEFFGTRLLHGSNASHTDYLNLNHSPYWLGLKELADKFNSDILEKLSQDSKKKSPLVYSQNALFSAMPRGDRKGFEECKRQCQLAGGALGKTARKISSLPFFWTWGPALLSLAKRIKSLVEGNKYASQSGHLIECEKVGEHLQIKPFVWNDFQSRVLQLFKK